MSYTVILLSILRSSSQGILTMQNGKINSFLIGEMEKIILTKTNKNSGRKLMIYLENYSIK